METIEKQGNRLRSMIESLKYANQEYYDNYRNAYTKFLNSQVVYAPYIRSKKEPFEITTVYLSFKKGWMACGAFPKCKYREIPVHQLFKLREGDELERAEHLPYEGVVAIEQFY